MRRIKNSLADWVGKGIITQSQADSIAAYETNKPQSNWVLYGFMFLGIAVIGTGIISLIAANWRDIPPAVKLFADFALLLGLAAVTLRTREKNPMLYEGFLAAFMLLCLATIGLISQVFHTGGELYMALLFWAAITLLPSMFSLKSFVPYIWASLFVAAIALLLIDNSFWRILFGHTQMDLMILPLFCLLLAVGFRTVPWGQLHANAFRIFAVLTGLVVLVFAEIGRYEPYEKYQFKLFLVPYLFVVAALVLIALNRHYRPLQKLWLTAVLLSFALLHHLPLWNIHNELLYAVISMTVLFFAALFFASIRSPRLFNLFVVLLGLRFLVLYFQALGGLAYTGFGLILSGVTIVGSVWLWQKYRQKLQIWSEAISG